MYWIIACVCPIASDCGAECMKFENPVLVGNSINAASLSVFPTPHFSLISDISPNPSISRTSQYHCALSLIKHLKSFLSVLQPVRLASATLSEYYFTVKYARHAGECQKAQLW